MKEFRLYWKSGGTTIVRGYDIADALTRAGYDGAVVLELDGWKELG